MSKTDKTRPTRVKLRDPDTRVRVEKHDHRDGECNFEAWLENNDHSLRDWPRKCGYTVSCYGYHNGFYARGPARWLKAEVRIRHGAARAQLRKDCHEMRKLSGDDLEDYDIINPRPRNGALWDEY